MKDIFTDRFYFICILYWKPFLHRLKFFWTTVNFCLRLISAVHRHDVTAVTLTILWWCLNSLSYTYKHTQRQKKNPTQNKIKQLKKKQTTPNVGCLLSEPSSPGVCLHAHQRHPVDSSSIAWMWPHLNRSTNFTTDWLLIEKINNSKDSYIWRIYIYEKFNRTNLISSVGQRLSLSLITTWVAISFLFSKSQTFPSIQNLHGAEASATSSIYAVMRLTPSLLSDLLSKLLVWRLLIVEISW